MKISLLRRGAAPLAGVALLGAGLWAALTPIGLPHAVSTRMTPAGLTLLPPPPPPPGGTLTEGHCGGTAGQENLISAPSASGSVPYSATYSDETVLACYVWEVNGNVVKESDTPSTTTTVKLTEPTGVSTAGDTVSLFTVDSDHGGNWDLHTWTSSTSTGATTVNFGSGCSATAGPETLISSPSAYGVKVSGGVGVFATYSDETVLHCHVWMVNGKIVPDNCTTAANSTSEQLCYRFPPTPGPFTVTLYVVDGDHGGNWDDYTWTTGGTYPPGCTRY